MEKHQEILFLHPGRLHPCHLDPRAEWGGYLQSLNHDGNNGNGQTHVDGKTANIVQRNERRRSCVISRVANDNVCAVGESKPQDQGAEKCVKPGLN